MDKIIIYQLLPRLFTNYTKRPKTNGSRKQNGSGTFSKITKEALQGIKELGTTHVWYTGILEHAIVEGYPKLGIADGNPRIIKGKAGSPYAIKDYYDVNPDLAEKPKKRIEEFKALVKRTHTEGLKVLIDFVPNHVAREYHSDKKPKGVVDFGQNDDTSQHFSNQNDFYYLHEPLNLPDECGTDMGVIRPTYEENPAKATGNDQFTAHINKNDWYETVKLNYGVNYTNGKSEHFSPLPAVWLKMKDILLYWAKMGIDGFRCDMVEMTPVAFWEWIIPQIRAKYPDLIFIAEVYNPQLYETYIIRGHFDYLYDKVGLYDTLRNILEHNQSARSISNVWQSLGNSNPQMLRFMENHDEQRIASKHFLNNGFNGLPAVFLCATMHTGPMMLYSGQEVGENAEGVAGYSGDDGRTTIFDYWTMPELNKWSNKGRFDGGKLTSWQKKLRSKYIDIMNITKYTAVQRGAFYDLMYANEENLNTNHIYAYIRHSKTQRLLFVINFHKTDIQTFRLKIPQHTFDIMEVPNTARLVGKELIQKENEYIKSSRNELIEVGVEIQLAPLDYKVYNLEFGL